MSLVVTGATGSLGRLIVEALLRDGVPASEIVAGGRQLDKIADLAERGVRVARMDYNDAQSLADAFAGATTLMLVSGSEVGSRVAQHSAAIAAAVTAGVQSIVYTSAPAADSSALVLAPEHKATEELIAKSGLSFTILRNGWYTENYAAAASQAIASGVLVSSTADGRAASASRADYADAAASVLAANEHTNAVYELSGDVAWDHRELAATLTELSGREIVFSNVTPEQHHDQLIAAGLDEGTAGFVVALDTNIRDGLLAVTTGDLSRIIGRPTTPMKETLASLV
jgi:NAD(P)H dehydrogenase (quinone)